MMIFVSDPKITTQKSLSPKSVEKLYYITYNNIQKNCNKLPNNMNKWNTECIHLCFFPIAYSPAPIEYAIPPANSNPNPTLPNSDGNKFIFTIMHHPIIK